LYARQRDLTATAIDLNEQEVQTAQFAVSPLDQAGPGWSLARHIVTWLRNEYGRFALVFHEHGQIINHQLKQVHLVVQLIHPGLGLDPQR
jgi:hypothetical protein